MGNGILGPVPPPQPDFMELAQQQGRENRRAAQFELGANRPNEIGVTGSRTWSLRPGANPNNPQPGDWIVNTSLNSGEQGLYDASVARRTATGGLADAALARAGTALNTPYNSGLLGARPDLTAMGYGSDPASTRRRIEDAYYAAGTRYLGDRYADESKMRDSMLANKGIHMGSAAYDRAVRIGNQGRDQAYASIVDNAILAGDRGVMTDQQVRSQQLADLLADRQDRFSEETAFRNQPLQEYAALTGGAAPVSPEFQPYMGTAGVESSPIFNAGIAQQNQVDTSYDRQRANKARQAANRNSMWAGIGNIASLAATAFLGPAGGMAVQGLRGAATR